MRCTSSMNSTSPGVRLDSSAARSPACWIAGPLDMPQRPGALVRDDHRERRLAETRGARQQDVVGRTLLDAGRVQQQLKLAAHLLLPDELGERCRAAGRPRSRARPRRRARRRRGRHPPAGSFRAGPRVASVRRSSAGTAARSVGLAVLGGRSHRLDSRRARSSRGPTSACVDLRGDAAVRHPRSGALPRARRGDLAGELDHDELGGLRPDARHAAERRVVVGGDRLGDLRDAEGGEHAERRLRTDAGDAEQLGEHGQFVAALEAEQRQGVLADDEARVQVHVVADVRRARRPAG